MEGLAYVNGEFMDISRAKVSIEDRGFQFADSVYEVVVAYGNKIFRLAEHLRRFQSSCDAIALAFDFSDGRLQRIIQEGLERTRFPETIIYMQITRGVCSRSLGYPEGLTPTVVATFKPKVPLTDDVRRGGVSVITTPDQRRVRCDIKSVSLLPNVLAKRQAWQAGTYDALFVDAAGHVREGTASNVFVIDRGTLLTPPNSPCILPGITRDYVLECATRCGVPIEETPVTIETLKSADEVFLSSTTIEILAVIKVDQVLIGKGVVGPVTAKLYNQFLAGVREAARNG